MSFPYRNTGSLCSGFPPDRPVCLPVKRPYAITLCGRLPIVLRAPLEASVTLLEATTPVKLPAKQCPRIRGLELKQPEGRISTAAPQGLASPLHCLRPILHTGCPNSMLSYSKGSRGLFVPSRVIGIFTDTTISLSSRLRQPASFDFAQPCVFGKQLPGPILCASPKRGPFIPKLQGQFA